MLNAEVANVVSATIGEHFGASLGVPALVLAPAQRDLGWLASLVERKRPFQAVAHCLCSAPL